MKTIVYIGTSLDNFIARENGDIDWLMEYSSPEVFQSYEVLMKRVDCVLLGRGTFEKVLSFTPWPYTCPVFVASRRLQQIPSPLEGKVELINQSPKAALGYLSQKGFPTVYVDGGRLIQSFLRENLINELIISTVPVLIGRGIPLFGILDSDIKFKHSRTESFSNGLVMSFYEKP